MLQSCFAAKKKKLRGFSPPANYTDRATLYRLSDRRLSAKLVPTLADRGCRVVSATNPHGRPDGHCLGLFCIYNILFPQ
jgi:hypothetical protein